MAFPNNKTGEHDGDKTRESAPPLVKQIWEFLEEQLAIAERREMTEGRFVASANEVTIGGFWSEHEDQEEVRNLEILESMLGEEMCGGICAGSLEYAHQPPTGLVSGIPQVLVQDGSGIHV